MRKSPAQVPERSRSLPNPQGPQVQDPGTGCRRGSSPAASGRSKQGDGWPGLTWHPGILASGMSGGPRLRARMATRGDQASTGLRDNVPNAPSWPGPKKETCVKPRMGEKQRAAILPCVHRDRPRLSILMTARLSSSATSCAVRCYCNPLSADEWCQDCHNVICTYSTRCILHR